MTRSTFSCGLGLLVLVACNDRLDMRPPAPVPPPVPTNAWLHFSDSSAQPGAIIQVAAYAKSVEGGPIGSFTARLLYDSLQLQVIESDSLGDGALRAVNPVAGEYRIAGASSTGLRDGLLFRVKARVIDPRGLRRVGLVLDELHSTRFAELTRKLEVQDGRAELLSTMKGVRIGPSPTQKP